MKKVLPLLLSLIFLSVVYQDASAQIRKIPASVTEAFKAKYPTATNVEWKDKLSGYNAEFEMDGIDHEARFNNKAEWQYTEDKIQEVQLPDAVKDGYAKSKYAEWSKDDFHKIHLPGDKIQYRIQCSKSDLQKKNLLFSSTGQLLKDNITL